MTGKERYELELIKTQTSLLIKQAQTEFWKIGIAVMVAGAAIGGVAVNSILN